MYMDIPLLYNNFVCIYIPDYIILLPIRHLHTVYFPVRAGAIGTVGALLINGRGVTFLLLGGDTKRRSSATVCGTPGNPTMHACIHHVRDQQTMTVANMLI